MMNYFWILIVLGVLAIVAYAAGSYMDSLEKGRHNTNLKICRRRIRNAEIRLGIYEKGSPYHKHN